MIKIQDAQPDDIRFDYYKTQRANQFTEFGNLVPANNNSIAVAPYGQWEVNDNCEVTILSPTKIRIDKFQIDRWIVRIKTGSGDGLKVFKDFQVNVQGLTYLHENIICHTDDTPDGFGKYYLGTVGWQVTPYPGWQTSGYYAQGLLIQGCMNYTDNSNYIANSLHMGRTPWDIGGYTFIEDGTAKTKAYAGINCQGICIGLFGGLQTAANISDTSNGAFRIYDISDCPLYIDIDVPDKTLIMDPSTDTCYKVYVGETQVYNNPKTIQKCWIDKNLATLSDQVITINSSQNVDGFTSIKLPTVEDLEEHILPSNGSNIPKIKWRGKVNNQEILNRLVTYLKTHDIVQIEEGVTNYSPYTQSDANMISSQWFDGLRATIEELHLNFNGVFEYQVFTNCFSSNIIKKLVLQFKQDNLSFSSLQHFFRSCTINEIQILDKNGNDATEQGKFFLNAIDISGFREFGYGLTIFPPIVNWTARGYSQESGSWYTNIAYAFSYSNDMEEIEEHPKWSRDSSNNTILSHRFAAQAFQGCTSLRRIGPTLDLVQVIPGTNTTGSGAYKMFENCTALEDVRIKNLNAGVWRFNDNAYAGVLPNLNQESITYLFTNLMDLTEYDESVAVLSASNNFNLWTFGWTYTNTAPEGYTRYVNNIFTDMRIPESWPDLFAQTSVQLNNIQIRVAGLKEGDKIVWTGDDLEITQDGLYNISGAGGFRLINTNITNNQTYRGDNVTIYLTKSYSEDSPHGSSGSIYCPKQWESKITQDLLMSANAKGWSLWIGDEELKPDSIGVLLADGTQVPYSSVPTEGYTSGEVQGIYIDDDTVSLVIALEDSQSCYFCGGASFCDALTASDNVAVAVLDMNGKSNTEELAKTLTNQAWAVNVAKKTFNGKGYLMSLGEWTHLQNYYTNELQELLVKCGGTALLASDGNSSYWTSSLNWKLESGALNVVWIASMKPYRDGGNVQGMKFVRGACLLSDLIQ